jgi:nitrogen fixation-related uncharacterized protein
MLQDLTYWLVTIAIVLVFIILAIRIFLTQYGTKKGNWRNKF